MKNKIFEILSVAVGGIVFAIAVAWIASPVGLVTGGVTGIGIIIKELTEKIPIFITGLVLNIPLFIVCTVQRGFRFIIKSTVAFITLTLALSLVERIPTPFNFENDLLLSSISYGILSGIGLGLILRAGATSGGTDMLAAIIKKSRPALPISRLIAVIDIGIVLTGAFVFGLRISLYATLALFLSAKVMDLTLSGIGSEKSVFIVSGKSREISNRIFAELKRGVTGIEAEGMYTGEKKKMLFLVVSSREIASVRRLVGEIDARAFIAISDAKEVLGEGFDDIFISSDSLS